MVHSKDIYLWNGRSGPEIYLSTMVEDKPRAPLGPQSTGLAAAARTAQEG
jgi:hypothetical protein